MTSDASTTRPPALLVCAKDPEVLALLLQALQDRWQDVVAIHGCTGAEDLLELGRRLSEQDVKTTLVVASAAALPEPSRIRETSAFRLSELLLLGEDPDPAASDSAPSFLAWPATPDDLNRQVSRLVTRWLIRHAPPTLQALGDRVDTESLTRALVDSEHHRYAMRRELHRLQSSFLADRSLSDDQVDRLMIDDFEKALHHPEHERCPAGTVLLREGQAVEHVIILMEGQVRLTRLINQSELVFHSASVGRIIGLLALAQDTPSTFTCRAVTEVAILRVSLDSLEQVLQNHPGLSLHFVTVLLRSLAKRNRRAIQLQTENSELLLKLERERDQLARTLHQLKAAQIRLVESEKMATLGQMASGVGHELNNPVAAIRRAAEFLKEDLEKLAGHIEDQDTFLERLHAALSRAPQSTRDQREQTRRLQEVTGDRDLAKRMVKIGLTEPGNWHLLGDRAQEHLARLETYDQVGSSLRNILSGSERIISLVQSMRSYARADEALEDEVDLHTGIEETLLLFKHQLRDIQVEKDFGELPGISAYPGKLNQVWTNLISNAVQVLPRDGRLTIHTDYPDPLHVRVQVIDNGPGIPEENLERIFDVNFTTRQGMTGFGLGIGLPICRDIIHYHGGDIEVDSRPGCTRFIVTLPVRQEHDVSRPLP